jgi:hypothetical protein
MVYVIQVCRQLSSRTRRELRSCSKAVYKPVWHIPLLSVQWINSWWWTEELSETCRDSCQNKSVKLRHLVGFTVKRICNGYTDRGLGLRVIVLGRELGHIAGAFKALGHGCDWIEYANHRNDGHPVVTRTGLFHVIQIYLLYEINCHELRG